MWWGERDPGSRMTEPDRLILQALTQYEAGVCECGHHRSQSMDSAHDPGDPEHVAKYDAGSPFRCHACTELGPDNAVLLAGTKWVTELVPRRPPT